MLEDTERQYHHGRLRIALLDAARTILDHEGVDHLTIRAVARLAGRGQLPALDASDFVTGVSAARTDLFVLPGVRRLVSGKIKRLSPVSPVRHLIYSRNPRLLPSLHGRVS